MRTFPAVTHGELTKKKFYSLFIEVKFDQ